MRDGNQKNENWPSKEADLLRSELRQLRAIAKEQHEALKLAEPHLDYLGLSPTTAKVMAAIASYEAMQNE